ncbi:MAG: phosphoribosylglycinamide formyltransferase [Candidatus Thermoplasmatota archaeon]
MKEKGIIGVLISGRGTNLQAIIDSIERGYLDAKIAVVISNKSNAYGLERARKHGIPNFFIDHRGKKRELFEDEIIEVLNKHNVQLIVLAGFMRILTPHFINAYRNRIINIHPALLPSFPGTHAQKDAIDWGVKVSGCTVHFVDENPDGGPIIVQRAVEVMEGDDENSLAERILKEEHKILPLAIKLFFEGRLRIEGRKVRIV